MKKHRIALPEIGQNLKNYYNVLHYLEMEPVAVTEKAEEARQKMVLENAGTENYIPEFLEFSKFRVEDFDGLLLPGGGDILPARYGETNHGKCSRMLEALDELQSLYQLT